MLGRNNVPAPYHEARQFGHHRKLWAFGAFAGLPSAETERDEHAGLARRNPWPTYGGRRAAPAIRRHVRVVVGVFPDREPIFSARR